MSWKREATAYLKDSTLYAAANGFKILAYFLAILILTAELTSAEYGKAALFLSLSALMTPLLNFKPLLQRSYHRLEQPDFTKYLANTLAVIITRTAWCVPLVAIVVAGYLFITGMNYSWAFLALLLASIQMLQQSYLSILQTARRPGAFNALQTVENILYLSLVSVCAVMLKTGWLAPIIALLIATGVVLVTAHVMQWREQTFPNIRADKKARKEIALSQSSLLPHIFFAEVALQGGYLVIAFFLSNKDLGLFALAMHIGVLLHLYCRTAMQALTPWMHRFLNAPDATSRQALMMLSTAYLTLLLLLCFLLGWFAEPILALISNSSYHDAAPLFGWICVGAFFRGIVMLTNTAIVFFPHAYGKLSRLTIACALIYMILSAVLVLKFGIAGAAMAFAASFAIRAAWQAALLVKIYPGATLESR